MRRYQSAAELLVASLLWGFGFIATVWALPVFTPAWMTLLRFFIAAGLTLPFFCLSPSLRRWTLDRQQWKLSLLPGVLLSATILLQTFGLRYTTATKSGFITTLYVLFVPILDRLVLRAHLSRWHAAFVSIALLGMAWIVELDFANLNIGDLMTFACALTASVQIFWFAVIADRIGNPFVFNSQQAFWGGLLAVPFAFGEPIPGITLDLNLPILGLALLTFCSTLVAFGLQVKAQRYLPASLASLICLMESPFAAVFSYLFLHERLKALQWFGALLILASVVAAVLLPMAKAKAAKATNAMA